MKPSGFFSATHWPPCRLPYLVAVTFCVLAVAAGGAPPLDPLPEPLFSFGAGSPTVASQGVGADEMLGLNSPNLETRFHGWAFGLGLYMDDLDAHSVGNSDFPADAPLALLFSVDVDTVGIATPDPALVDVGVPYNAQDQAQRGQAAGDQFMSTRLFTRGGSMGTIAAIDLSNNVLVRNNFDEGGTDFVASPESSAIDIITGNVEQDRVDATTTLVSGIESIYFSASAVSPSLSLLSDTVSPSGANIFVFSPPGDRTTLKEGSARPPRVDRDPTGPSGGALCDVQAKQAHDDCIASGGTPDDCETAVESMRQDCLKNGYDPPCQAICCQQSDQIFVQCLDGGGTIEYCAELSRQVLWDCLENECGVTPGPPPGLYASFGDMGLQQDDDIDGLIVFDTDGDRTFNGGDHVLFSLTADSPSLATIAGASATGAAADVFVVTPGRQAPTLFVSAADLGLGHEDDNIDALDYTPCTDSLSCAAAHGIRSNESIPTLSAWGMITMTLLLITAASVLIARKLTPPALSPSR